MSSNPKCKNQVVSVALSIEERERLDALLRSKRMKDGEGLTRSSLLRGLFLAHLAESNPS